MDGFDFGRWTWVQSSVFLDLGLGSAYFWLNRFGVQLFGVQLFGEVWKGSKFGFGGRAWVWVNSQFDLSSSNQFEFHYIWVRSNTSFTQRFFKFFRTEWLLRGLRGFNKIFQKYVDFLVCATILFYLLLYFFLTLEHCQHLRLSRHGNVMVIHTHTTLEKGLWVKIS